MPQGLQVWDSSGNLVLDTTHRTGFILGHVTISSGNQSGSITDSDFAKGTPFFLLVGPTLYSGNEPNVSFSGNTMTWSPTTSAWQGAIYYGFF